MKTFHHRKLPHLYNIGQPIFITWRLYGSLPSGRSFPSAATAGAAFVAIDRLLDEARAGPLYLRMPDLATMVVEAIHFRETTLLHYDLHAYAVMANHVHLLITPAINVSKLMQSLKRHTAREANRTLGLTGHPFWAVESYDRLVRDETEFRRIASYIEMNPVKAGLVAAPEDFPWSSASGPCTRAASAHAPPHAASAHAPPRDASAHVRQAGSLRRVGNPPSSDVT
jgi:REP element-mobilizing transposase RayT